MDRKQIFPVVSLGKEKNVYYVSSIIPIVGTVYQTV